MSRHSSEVLRALEQAARAPDDGAFDAAFDELLRQARFEANPSAALRALSDARLRDELGAVTGANGASLSASGRHGEMSGSGVRPISTSPRRWARFARATGIMAIGVAIGFIWGRSSIPAPDERDAQAPDTEELSALDTAAISEAVPASELPPARDTAADSAAQSAVTSAANGAARTRASRALDNRAPSAGAESLRFVLEQLRKAQLFLRAGEPNRALAALDLIDARVPAAVLQDEREVTRAFALCEAGEVAAATSLAERVLARSPDSAYALSLDESCAGKARLLDKIRDHTSNQRR